MNDVAYYMKLPYLIEVRPAEGGGFYARYPELVTPHGDGPTVADAVREADVSKELFFELCLEHGDPIPEPDETKNYSGNFVVRAPPSLHRDLAQRARTEGVSINQLVVTYISRGVGTRW